MKFLNCGWCGYIYPTDASGKCPYCGYDSREKKAEETRRAEAAGRIPGLPGKRNKACA